VKSFLRLFLLSLLFLGRGIILNAQSIIIQEGDTVFLCEPDTVILHAFYQGADSSDLHSSAPLSSIDDAYDSTYANIGFPFTFFGTTYTQCFLSTNFYITFDPTAGYPLTSPPWANYSSWPINAPAPVPGYPANTAIMGPWHDTYPGVNPTFPGWISYTTIGDAPNRVFIFNMCMVPMYSCTDSFFSGQIKLFETSNVIEFHITEKSICYNWNDGAGVLGVQSGNLSSIIYNYPTQWTAYNQAWRLTPTSPTSYASSTIPYDPVQVYATNQLQWHGANIPNSVFSDTIIVDAQQSGWVYVDFFGCFGNTLSQAGSDSIYIAISYTDYTQSQRTSACNDPAHNALFMNFPTNVNGPYDLMWMDSLGNVLQVDSNRLDIDSLSGIPSGLYHVLVTNAIGCTFNYDFTVPVHQMTPSFTWLPNLICQGSPVTFTNTSTGSITRNFWHLDNDTAQVANPVHSFYSTGDSIRVVLTISNDTFTTCVFSDTAYLQVHPNIVASAILDSPRCVGQYVYFRDMSEPYPVTWQWFEEDSLISTDSVAKMIHGVEGAYPLTLVVTDSLCGVDTLESLIFVNHFPIVDIGNDTLLCPGESIELNAGNPGNEYLWSNGMTTQSVVITPSETMLVSVDVNNMGCNTIDELLITMNCSMIFPNAFTPNGDGINDYFMPHLINMKIYDFFIYNRWGQLVFASTDNSADSAPKGWDGTFHNEKAPIASYVYYAQGFDIKDQPVKTMGTFTLLR